MALAVGTRFGTYEITGALGAGGMGEVYRAHDTELGRDVAIKVLPESFSTDPARVARFEQEAKTLAALNHSNIAQIYGLARNDGVTALAMELVEGTSLAERIAQGPLPVDEALRVAAQIAEALEAAHERGIVHRDLKPANIQLTADGLVKVLDFGIAKALDTRKTSSGDALVLTTPAMTEAGIVLGTAAYMSPEQARGKAVDQRADVWAFGCVLYEMLTGQLAFGGEDVTIVLARVLERSADLTALPSTTPPAVRRTLELCLEKDPRKRIRHVGDVRMALAGRFETVAAGSVPASRAWRRLALGASAAALVAVVAAAGVWLTPRPDNPGPLHLALTHPGPGVPGGNAFDANIAMSADGRSVAYVASTEIGNVNGLDLYLRRLDRPEPIRLSGAARSPFFSPDGRWVGFVENNGPLSRVLATGGPVVRIGGNANAARGATWGPDDTIVYAANNPDFGTGLRRIPMGGGEIETLTTPDASAGEALHTYPEFLPGGEALLFTIVHRTGEPSDIAVLDLATRSYRTVQRGGSHARYSASGHLVYGIEGALYAVPFDLDRLETRGTPVPVLAPVVTTVSGAAGFGLAGNGTLAYFRGDDDRFSTIQALSIVDRAGQIESLGLEAGSYSGFAVSPDGSSLALAYARDDDTNANLWVASVARQTMTRLPASSADEDVGAPLWTPDGRRIVYSIDRRGLYWRAADGTGAIEPLLETDARVFARSWSSDGNLILSMAGDIYSLAPNGEGELKPVLTNAAYVEDGPALSPDGRWLAYVSDESGNEEIYVRPYPDVEAGKWQISLGSQSAGRARQPRWTPDGRELTYMIAQSTELMSVAVETGAGFSASAPTLVGTRTGSGFTLFPDGRLLVTQRPDEAESLPPQLSIVLNWFDELEQLAPRD